MDNELQNICTEDYFSTMQTDVNERVRAILVDWLIGVAYKFQMKEQTLFMTVNIIDRYLNMIPLKKEILQIVGITALFMAGKYEEIYPFPLNSYLKLCDNQVTESMVKDLEGFMLLALNFDFVFNSSLFYYDFFTNSIGLEK